MNPYMTLSTGANSPAMTTFAERLSAWHDAMVAHERRLRAGSAGDVCDEECPHAEARALWVEAVAAFGARAQELTFLRSRGVVSRRSQMGSTADRTLVDTAADRVGRRARTPGVAAPAIAAPPAAAATEL